VRATRRDTSRQDRRGGWSTGQETEVEAGAPSRRRNYTPSRRARRPCRRRGRRSRGVLGERRRGPAGGRASADGSTAVEHRPALRSVGYPTDRRCADVGGQARPGPGPVPMGTASPGRRLVRSRCLHPASRGAVRQVCHGRSRARRAPTESGLRRLRRADPPRSRTLPTRLDEHPCHVRVGDAPVGNAADAGGSPASRT
jgi:hypothetical protein